MSLECRLKYLNSDIRNSYKSVETEWPIPGIGRGYEHHSPKKRKKKDGVGRLAEFEEKGVTGPLIPS